MAAQYFATSEHVIKRQQMYGARPYTHHLQAVEELLRRWGVDEEDMLIAAWLHDIVEDCPEISLKHIEEMFGPRVAELVDAVTNEPGPNRAARHALTHPKTRTVPGAVLLKLADRLANVANGRAHGGIFVGMYAKEHETFKRALYTPGEWEAQWTELEAALAW